MDWQNEISVHRLFSVHCWSLLEWQYAIQLIPAVRYSAKPIADEQWKRTQMVSKCIFLNKFWNILKTSCLTSSPTPIGVDIYFYCRYLYFSFPNRNSQKPAFHLVMLIIIKRNTNFSPFWNKVAKTPTTKTCSKAKNANNNNKTHHQQQKTNPNKTKAKTKEKQEQKNPNKPTKLKNNQTPNKIKETNMNPKPRKAPKHKPCNWDGTFWLLWTQSNLNCETLHVVQALLTITKTLVCYQHCDSQKSRTTQEQMGCFEQNRFALGQRELFLYLKLVISW